MDWIFGDVVENVAVRHHQIQPAVIVEIGEVAPEGEFGEALASDSEGRGGVQEEPAAEVPVKGVRLEVEVRDDEVHAPVTVHVSPIVAHPGFREALLVVRDAGCEPVLDKPDPLRPGLRPEQEVRGRVVRDVHVRRTVVSEVRDDNSQPLPFLRTGNGNGPERPVPQVLEEGIGRSRVFLRVAVGQNFLDRTHAVAVPFQRVVEVIRGVHVQIPVPVGIEERGTGRPAGIARTAGARDFAKGPVSPIPEEPFLAEMRDEQVRIAVAVEVTRHRAHAVTESVRRIQQSRFLGAVPKGSVPAVSEKTVPDRRPARVTRQGVPVHEKKIRPTVAVVIEHRDAPANDLDHETPAAAAILVVEPDSCRLRPVHEDEILSHRRRCGE